MAALAGRRRVRHRDWWRRGGSYVCGLVSNSIAVTGENAGDGSVTLSYLAPVPVPEPGALGLLGASLTIVSVVRGRRGRGG